MAADRDGASFRERVRRIGAPMRGGAKMWEGARFVLADVPLDGREAKKILPWGLRLDDPPTATLFIADYVKTSFTFPYKEVALLIHVRTLLGRGRHCPWMIVDDDTGMIYGRELLGYPKKFGEFTLDGDDCGVKASISRRGVEVLRMEAEKKDSETSPAPVFDVKTFNAGGPGQLFVFQPIWMFRPREIVTESWSAEVKVTLEESEYDPIAGLVDGAPANGRFVVMDILGSRYNLPVGVAGPRWFVNNFYLRYR